ncbi:Type IV fimbrial biogenesis protein [Sterolibacterium denitrificans]|uniref:Type IV fimbrial biogenesis protein n=1 Tax=Sterolibacterium denitrificans TaxID=157592 RepID=A0A7Z7MV12_9PROT|nr:type IV pilus biogenesis/stability protein PilW [Sterolibacterium denitrificans]SMB25473.1 Type IV fimbrial biogenesis protein [Sterolibacterium denitrificans]
MLPLRHVASSGLSAVVLLLAGCATELAGVERSAEQPVSQQAATSDSQQRAKVHTELGALYLQNANLAVALDEARVALSADPGYAPAYSLMGLTYMQMRENASAEKSFEQALRIAPNDPEINNNFGWFLCQTGREQRSLSYFNIAIKSPLYATPAMPLTNAGICLLRLKDDKGAEEYFMRALKFDPENIRAIFLLADICYRQDRLSAARLHLSELQKLVEPSAELVWLALRIERKSGNRQSEARYAAQLRQDFVGSPEHLKLLQGQYE